MTDNKMNKTWKQIGNDCLMETKKHLDKGELTNIVFSQDPKDQTNTFFLRFYVDSKDNRYYCSILDGFFIVTPKDDTPYEENIIGPSENLQDLLESIELIFDIETAEVFPKNSIVSQMFAELETEEEEKKVEIEVVDFFENEKSIEEKIMGSLSQKEEEEEEMLKEKFGSNYYKILNKVTKECGPCEDVKPKQTSGTSNSNSNSNTKPNTNWGSSWGGDYHGYSGYSTYTPSLPVKTQKTLGELSLSVNSSTLKLTQLQEFIDNVKVALANLENKTEDAIKISIEFDESNRSFPTLTLSAVGFVKPTTSSTTTTVIGGNTTATNNTTLAGKPVGAEEIAAKSGNFRNKN